MDIARDNKPPQPKLQEDMAVLLDLIVLCRKRDYVLSVSADAETEIARVERPDRRQELLQQLQQFELLPAMVENDEAASVADALKEFMLSKTRITKSKKKQALHWDARHFASCRLSGCHIFLTTDYGSIWAYRRTLKRIHGITVRRPVELYEELTITQRIYPTCGTKMFRIGRS